MGEDLADDLIRAQLARLWQGRDLDAVASAAARGGVGQGGGWEPPAGLARHADLLALNIGIPDSASLPRAQMSAALQAVLECADDLALRYDLRGGYLPLREHLAQAYSRQHGHAVDAEHFQLCTGSAGAIDLVVRALLEPGDVVFAEAPTYLGTLRNFRGALADVRSVPLDSEGLCVEALAEAVRACRRQRRRVKLVYTIAAFQNPTGRTLSASRRRALLELAAAEGFLVLDDDTYGELHYGERPEVPALSALAGGHGVITVGSFSKVLATGLRVGWVHARPELISVLQRMRFEMGQNQLAVHMIARLANDGALAAHLQRVRALYREKMQCIAAALERHAGRYLRFERPAGGFYLWAELAEGLTAEQVWRAGHRQGVAVSPGYDFFGDRHDQTGEHLRIAFSWTPLERLEEAAQRLAFACERVAAGDLA